MTLSVFKSLAYFFVVVVICVFETGSDSVAQANLEFIYPHLAYNPGARIICVSHRACSFRFK